MLPPYCPIGDPEFMPDPARISLIHPNFYNQALRTHGVHGVTVTEVDGQMKVNAEHHATDQMVNAIAALHMSLVAATSHMSNVKAAKEMLAEAKGHVDDAAVRERMDDVIESLDQSIGSLTNLTPTR